jgi:hypothetical protein
MDENPRAADNGGQPAGELILGGGEATPPASPPPGSQSQTDGAPPQGPSDGALWHRAEAPCRATPRQPIDELRGIGRADQGPVTDRVVPGPNRPPRSRDRSARRADRRCVRRSPQRGRGPVRPARDRLDTITRVGRRAAETIIAEISLDMARFPTTAHLASWAGVAPATTSPAANAARARLPTATSG